MRNHKKITLFIFDANAHIIYMQKKIYVVRIIFKLSIFKDSYETLCFFRLDPVS